MGDSKVDTRGIAEAMLEVTAILAGMVIIAEMIITAVLIVLFIIVIKEILRRRSDRQITDSTETE